MDCTCNCFGVATAARVPVKRYNLLVPDVFPVVEPPFDKPLGIGIERKIKKLGEYLEKNEFRAPKVSRRLQRRLHQELGAGRYGYVKLAVEAYCHLLALGKPEKSNLLAYELVVGTVVKRRRLLVAGPKAPISFPEPHLGSAVGLLLSHPDPQLRKLGVDLLTRFLQCQQTSDYVPQLEAFVPLLCENAKPSASPPASGDAGEAWAALRAASLRGLLEHLRFCARLSYVSYHLHTITFAVLECVEAASSGMPKGALRQELMKSVGADGSDDAALAAAVALGRGSLGAAVGASPPDVAAVLVFEELAHMTRDAAEGKKVLEFVMRFLDGRRRWLGSAVLAGALAVLRAACCQEHQRYLLFSSLLHHGAAATALAPDERAAVLALAVGEGAHLEAGLAAPALLLALRELPALLAAAGGGPEADPPPMPPQQAGPPVPSPAGPAQPSSREVELAALPRGGAAAAAAAQQQADLQAGVLAAVGQLAARVGDRATLLEAVSGTLGRLRGAAPLATATLQCCVAAAQAAQPVAPAAARGSAAPRAFPSLLLRELAGIAAGWGPQQRLLAARLLLLLLRGAADGLKEGQAAALLSAAWHAAALPDGGPAQYAALDRLVRAVLGAAPAAALPQVLQLAAGLQAEVLEQPGGGRLAQLSAAQCCAVLCVCSSALAALAAQLGQPALQQLAAPGCEGVLRQLGVAPPRGVVLGGPGGDEAGGGQQAFWQSPAAQLRFTEEEQAAAGAFLAAWRGSTSPAAQQAAAAAALAAVPLFAQQGGSAAGPFKPLPQSSLMPHLMTGAFAAHGPDGGNASSGRAQRLRSVYRHVRQISLCDGDRAALAAISQESAAEEGQPSSLHTAGLALPWLVGGDASAGPGAAASVAKTADDVLAEVDAALEAAEEAMERGGGPWPAALHSVADGSSGSRGTGRGGGSLRRGLPQVANGQLLVA